MSVEVAVVHGNAKCDAACVKCDKEAVLIMHVGENTSTTLCVACAKLLFNALGFMVISQTGESLERLVGLRKRRGDL